MNSDFIAKMHQFYEEVNINKSQLKDIITAIVTADKVFGVSDTMSFDYIFCHSEDAEINQIFDELRDSTEIKGTKNIPKIRQYRVYSDALTIYCKLNNISVKEPILTLNSSCYVDKLKVRQVDDVNIIKKYIQSILDFNVKATADNNIMLVLENIYKIAPSIKFEGLVLPPEYKTDWGSLHGISYDSTMKLKSDSDLLKRITSSIILGLRTNIDHSLSQRLHYTGNMMTLHPADSNKTFILNASAEAIRSLGDLRNCLCGVYTFSNTELAIDTNIIYDLVLVFYSKNKKVLDKNIKMLGGSYVWD